MKFDDKNDLLGLFPNSVSNCTVHRLEKFAHLIRFQAHMHQGREKRIVDDGQLLNVKCSGKCVCTGCVKCAVCL